MPYFLVLFREGPSAGELGAHAEAHEDFVTSLIRRNLVLLGGDFRVPLGDVDAAYVLRCRSLEEARAVAADDPLFRTGVYRPEVVEWDLVGINADAIDASAALTPADLQEGSGERRQGAAKPD